MKKPEWDSQQIQLALEQNNFTYQNVPLPHGLATGGDDRSPTAERIFPKDLTGKSIFDVGCMYGFFCFFAESRGATRCIGADIDPDNVRKSSLLAEIRQSSARFRHFDIEKDEIGERFDYILCLNVLHHLRNPLAALDKLINATKETLVLEVASFGSRDRRKNRLSWLAAQMLKRLPVLFVARSSSQTFFMTAEALRRLFLEHRADFARVDFIEGAHKGRFLAIARRRSVKHLFVVAGMPAGGKSTLIQVLTSSQVGALAEQIGFSRETVWDIQRFGSFAKNREQYFDGILLHYNICKHMIDGDLYHHSRALADLMAVSDQVTVVTVARPREQLLKQFKETRMNKTKRSLFSARHRKKLRRVAELYAHPESLMAEVLG